MDLQIASRATPLYSHPCKPPGMSPMLLSLCKNDHSQTASLFFSEACRLFVSLASLFRTSVLCFQSLAASFGKIPGWGVGLLGKARSGVDIGCVLWRYAAVVVYEEEVSSLRKLRTALQN